MSTEVADPDDRPNDPTVDVVVIGGGAAGLSGALMLARSRRSVVVLDGGTPRNAVADGVRGLLGLDGIAPAELLARGRLEVEGYGGQVLVGEVISAEATDPGPAGDPRFAVRLADGRTWRARRLLVATGLRDVLPEVPGLAAHWGHGVVHCPYCHGYEVRDHAIGVLGGAATSLHQVWLFRQLTDDLLFFTQGSDLDDETRARLAARAVTVVDTPVAGVESDGSTVTGVRLTDGRLVARNVLAVATTMQPRLEGLADLGLPVTDLPNGMGRHVETGMAGSTAVAGVWSAGNVAEPHAQVGAAASAGALAGAHINAHLATADTTAARELAGRSRPAPALGRRINDDSTRSRGAN